MCAAAIVCVIYRSPLIDDEGGEEEEEQNEVRVGTKVWDAAAPSK